MDYGKKFIIVGNINALGWKETFPYIKGEMMWTGYNPITDFVTYSGENGKVGCRWYTNIDIEKRNNPIDLYKRYSNEYPRYANYDAIDVAKVSDIPMDYDGIMGVPLSFVDVYCPAQFEIIGVSTDTEQLKVLGGKPIGEDGIALMRAQGGKAHVTPNSVELYYIKDGIFKKPFVRIFIRKRTA